MSLEPTIGEVARVSTDDASAILALLKELRACLAAAAVPVEPPGLLDYQDLRKALTVGRERPRVPCLRTVKELARKHRGILRPVELGSRTVGFRPERVKALLSHLAGDKKTGGLL